LIAFFGVTALKKKLGYDDSLDAFGVHFLAGLGVPLQPVSLQRIHRTQTMPFFGLDR
jgi:hypothetical protein